MTAARTDPAATGRADDPLLAQSLSSGIAGTALVSVERSLAGEQAWPQAHTQIAAAARYPLVATPQAGLYYGAPAIGFLLACAQADGTPRYPAAVGHITAIITTIAEQRLSAAAERIAGGNPADFAEYDLFYGLTGIAVLLMLQDPGSDLLRRVLDYLIGLTRPRPDELPGWWVSHDPDHAQATPGGHANFGMAHGAAGLLAVLSAAARRDVLTDGQHDAIRYLCDWFTRWQQDGPAGPWWPHWVTGAELAAGRPVRHAPTRASWCYGTPGISRALQQAAIALGDSALQQHAEQALAACLADPSQLQPACESSGLCHGIAGVYQTAWRVARDAATPLIAPHLPHLTGQLRVRAAHNAGPASLLNGTSGLTLALRTASSGQPPISGWDTCLLIS